MTKALGTRIAATVLLSLALVVAPTAFAGKGGNGGGKPGGSSTTATLVPSCNPCAAGSVVSFSGDGYDTSYGVVQLNIAGAITSTGVNGDGTVAFDWPYFNVPGTYSVKAYQKRGGRFVLKAEVAVTVV